MAGALTGTMAGSLAGWLNGWTLLVEGVRALGAAEEGVALQARRAAHAARVPGHRGGQDGSRAPYLA